jgi:hypothetical protein
MDALELISHCYFIDLSKSVARRLQVLIISKRRDQGLRAQSEPPPAFASLFLSS